MCSVIHQIYKAYSFKHGAIADFYSIDVEIVHSPKHRSIADFHIQCVCWLLGTLAPSLRRF